MIIEEVLVFCLSPSGKSERWQQQRLRHQGRWEAPLQAQPSARLRWRSSSRWRLLRDEKQAHVQSRPWAPCRHLEPSCRCSRRLHGAPSQRPPRGAQSPRCPPWLGHRIRPQPGAGAARWLRAPQSQPSRGWHARCWLWTWFCWFVWLVVLFKKTCQEYWLHWTLGKSEIWTFMSQKERQLRKDR